VRTELPKDRRSRRTLISPGADALTCNNVAIYGVRGAFEPFDEALGGMGSTLFGIAERTASLLAAGGPPLELELVGVAYPANAWLYLWSRFVGARNLARLLADDLVRRPDRRIVLIGLSQGADVIRHALVTLPTDTARRISAVVLLGDPTRHPRDPWNHGTIDPHPGVAVRYAAPIPEQLITSCWGYALDGDEIAANHKGLRGLVRSGTHTLYEHNHERVQDQSASFISEALLEDWP